MSFDKYSSTHTVTAEQITEERSVITPNGPMAALPGQWEVRHPDGNVQVVDDDQFTAAFNKDKEDVQEEQSEEKLGDTPVTKTEEELKAAEKSDEEKSVETASESKPEKTVKPPTRPK